MAAWSNIEMARCGDACWSGYEEVGQSTSLISWQQLYIGWAGSGKGEKVKAQGPAYGARAFTFSLLPDPAQAIYS